MFFCFVLLLYRLVKANLYRILLLLITIIVWKIDNFKFSLSWAKIMQKLVWQSTNSMATYRIWIMYALVIHWNIFTLKRQWTKLQMIIRSNRFAQIVILYFYCCFTLTSLREVGRRFLISINVCQNHGHKFNVCNL